MMRILTLVFLVPALAPIGAAAQSCAGPDLAITSLTVRSLTGTRYLNYFRVDGTITNVGSAKQGGDAMQFVDVNQYGHRLDDRGVPPLAPGQSYTVAYIWKRSIDAGDRTTPLSFHLREIAPSGLDACNAQNDSSSVQF